MNYKIVKEEENKVIYTPIKTIKDINGKDVQVYDTDNVKEYGQNRIDEERASLLAEKEAISTYDKTAKIKEVDAKLAVITELQTKILEK